jgi:hypothetical protein
MISKPSKFFDQLPEGLLGSSGMDHEKSRNSVGPNPELPGQTLLGERSLIKKVGLITPGFISDHLVMRFDRAGGLVEVADHK